MPYIKQERRDEYDPLIEQLTTLIKQNEHGDRFGLDGDANYVLTRIVTRVFKVESQWRYHSIARAVGCLQCVMMELYRRVAGVYENVAARKNGDVKEYAEFDQEYKHSM